VLSMGTTAGDFIPSMFLQNLLPNTKKEPIQQVMSGILLKSLEENTMLTHAGMITRKTNYLMTIF